MIRQLFHVKNINKTTFYSYSIKLRVLYVMIKRDHQKGLAVNEMYFLLLSILSVQGVSSVCSPWSCSCHDSCSTLLTMHYSLQGVSGVCSPWSGSCHDSCLTLLTIYSSVQGVSSVCRPWSGGSHDSCPTLLTKQYSLQGVSGVCIVLGLVAVTTTVLLSLYAFLCIGCVRCLQSLVWQQS